jgi:phosphatidate cytidylyltransferase
VSRTVDSNMMKRVAFAVVAIPLVLVFVWGGSWGLTGLLEVAAVLGTLELFNLAAKQGIRPFRSTGLVAAAVGPMLLQFALVSPDARRMIDAWWTYGVIMLVLVVLTQAVVTRASADHPLAAVAVTLFGIAYAVALPSVLFVIRHAQWGPESWTGTALVFFPLVVTWVCDSAAMFGGRLIGGAKLAPTISPGKTRAGAIAGLVGGTVIGAVFALLVFPRVGVTLGIVPAIMLALVLSVIGQIGDLAESLLKREAGVKDSSTLIPGHGGVLDRLDSLYFAIPVAAAGYHLLGVI